MPVIAKAVLTVVEGQPYLSPDWAAIVIEDDAWLTPHLTTREVEAIRLYAAGMKLRVVGPDGSVSPSTPFGPTSCEPGPSTRRWGRPTITK